MDNGHLCMFVYLCNVHPCGIFKTLFFCEMWLLEVNDKLKQKCLCCA